MPTENSASASSGTFRTHSRFPPTVAGIQVNHCKDPGCANFGVPPLPSVKRGGLRTPGAPKAVPRPGDYTVVATGKGEPALRCHLCGSITGMQSNAAIVEELLRISAYLEPVGPVCRYEKCALYGKSGTAVAGRFVHYGVNVHGTPRYKCKECGHVVTHGGSADKLQRDTHQNRAIFVHLMNAMPLRRIIKVLELSTSVLYHRIDFIHRQCLLFAGERERTLLDNANLGKRYVSIDRQKLLVNWSAKKDRKNTELLFIASADQSTGYVLGVHANFDASLDEGVVEKDRLRFGDDRLDRPFRRYARVWLTEDFKAAGVRAKARRAPKKPNAVQAAATPTLTEQLIEQVEATYAEAQERENIEAGGDPSDQARVPAKGMLLHQQAVMYAHVQFVTRLLHRSEKIRFFMDQESGLRAAFLSAVPARVVDRTADCFYVKVMKDMTVDRKRNLVKRFRDLITKMQKDTGEHDEGVILLRLMLEALSKQVALGHWGDNWVKHPAADMREPAKMVSWLTNIDPIEQDTQKREDQVLHYARLYLKAALTQIDRFFMQVRRGLTLAERGVVSASADRRLWFGKNAYNPGVLVKLLEIYRVYFNYCERGKDKQTPAMRLGLARGPVAPEDILYFVPKPPPRTRAKSALATR